MARTIHFYAIRLDDSVRDEPRFMARNPGYEGRKPCFYVGSSIHDPKTRFAAHKAGHKSSRWVRIYGQYVATGKCWTAKVTAAERDATEREYADELRARGYGVWQA